MTSPHDGDQASKRAAQTSALALAGTRQLGVGIAFQRGFQVFATVLLARLLLPGDFGLMTVAVVTFEAANMLRELGMSNALIHRRDRIQESADILFIAGWALSGILFATVVLLGPFLSGWTGNPRAGMVAAVLALELFSETVATVPRALAAKELNVRRQVIIGLWEAGTNGVVSVVLAMTGFGVWSLVGGALAGSGIGAVLWVLLSPWRPTWKWDWQVARGMAGFGVTLSAAGAVESAVELCSRAVISGVLGLVAVGFYDLANRSVNLTFRHGVIALGQRIALPAFCQVQEDLEQIRRWFLKIVFYSCLLMAPLAAALVILADVAVPVLLGQKWLSTVPLFRVLAILIVLMPLMYGRPIYVAIGRGDVLLRFAILRLCVFAPLFFLAARRGLLAACTTEVGVAAALAAINLFWISRLIGLQAGRIVRTLLLGLATTGYFVFLLLGLRLLWSRLVGEWNLVALVLVCLTAGALYLVVVYLRRRDAFLEMCGILGLSSNKSSLPGQG